MSKARLHGRRAGAQKENRRSAPDVLGIQTWFVGERVPVSCASRSKIESTHDRRFSFFVWEELLLGYTEVRRVFPGALSGHPILLTSPSIQLSKFRSLSLYGRLLPNVLF